jgi:tetratricopeptide (TPR) repeat protein
MPDRIGNWKILRLLGAGGAGAVFEACAIGGPPVRAAVKILAPARAGDPRARSRLEREARMLMQELHPNVVRVLEVDSAAPMPWLAMQLVEGATLREILDRARAREADAGDPACARLDLPGEGDSFARVARVGLGLAEALAWAHGRGLIHRDVKPGNVMVRADGTPVLLDFGLAADPESTALTRTGDVLGTPVYMAPEQARGGRAGPEVDIYGLGAVLFEMVTLRPPFEGSETSEVLRQVRTSVSPRVRRLEPRVPAPLAAVIERALSPRPAWRQRSAAAVAEDLRRFLDGQPVSAKAPSPVSRMLWRITARPVLALGAVALILLAVTAVLLLDREADADRTREALGRAIERAALQLVEPIGGNGLEATAREISALDPGSSLAPFLSALAGGRAPERSEDVAVARLADAESARLAGDRARSFALLAPALDDAPTSPVAWALACRLARDDAVRGGLIPRLISACEAAPDRPSLHAGLGHLLLLEKKPAEAAAAFSRALALAPEPGHLSFHEACALDRAARAQDGLAAARRGGADTLVRFGRYLDREKRRAEAWIVFREVLAAHGDRIDARFHLATSLAAAEEVESAAAEYRQVLARDATHAPALVSLAWIHAWVCGHERCAAVRDPERAIELAGAAVRADGGRERAILLTATRIAKHLDRREALVRVIRDLIGQGQAGGRDTALLEDALKDLAAP